MIQEVLSIASTALGLYMATRKSNDDNSDDTKNTDDTTTEEDSTTEDVTTTEEDNSEDLYFGDKNNYDPFYDYSIDSLFNSQYALTSIKGNSRNLSQAYRCRIISPCLSVSNYTLKAYYNKEPNLYQNLSDEDKIKYKSDWFVLSSDVYQNFGFGLKQVKYNNGEDYLTYLPMFKGSYSEIDCLIEVFNPFDFDAPLDKIRINGLSVGGEECYPIMNFHEHTHILDPTLKTKPETRSYIENCHALSFFGLDEYLSNYLVRVEPPEDFSEIKSADFVWKPSDFEINTLADFDNSDFEKAIYNYTSNQLKYRYEGGYDCNGKDGVKTIYSADGNSFYNSADSRDASKRGAVVQKYYSSSIKSARSMCDTLGLEIAGKSTIKVDPSDVTMGITNYSELYAKRITIPARGSVFLRLRFNAVRKPKVKFVPYGNITGAENEKNLVTYIKRDDLSDGQLCQAYHTWINPQNLESWKGGDGIMYYDFESIPDIAEQDFRFKIQCYSVGSDSVIQNHNSGITPRSENSRVWDVGMYRGERPQKGAIEFEKSYWDSYERYDNVAEALISLGSSNKIIDFTSGYELV